MATTEAETELPDIINKNDDGGSTGDERKREETGGVGSVSPSAVYSKKQIVLERGYQFEQKWISAARVIYNGTLIALSCLMILWDIAIPVALWQTGAKSYNFGKLSDFSDRPYGDTPIWWNPFFRQEFGEYWRYFITIHVFCAWVSFPLYIVQLFGAKKFHGSKFHKILGMIVLTSVTILWTAGGYSAAILVMERGFNPCEYVLSDQNCANAVRGTSFPFYLYLQFTYDGALLNECLMHGIGARILLGAQKPGEPRIIQMWQIMTLGFLSVSSIWLYVLRTFGMFGILIAYHTSDNGPDEYCIGDFLSTSAPDVATSWLMFGMYVAEGAFIYIVNIANLKFVAILFNAFHCETSPLKIPPHVWRHHHAAALTFAGFIVFWTFIANATFLFWPAGAAVSYIVLLIILGFYWVFVLRPSHMSYKEWLDQTFKTQE